MRDEFYCLSFTVTRTLLRWGWSDDQIFPYLIGLAHENNQ